MNTILYTTALGLICMLGEIFSLRKLLIPIVLTGLSIIVYLTLTSWGSNAPVVISGIDMSHMVTSDNLSKAFSVLALFTAALIFMMAHDYYKNEPQHLSDYVSILLFALVGALVLFSYANMAMLFLGIEILSISMYIMAGSRKYDTRSNEAGFKYFLMGAFASGFLLFGIALLYGATGSFELVKIGQYMQAGHASPLFYTGIMLLLVALLFKVSAVPFHFWSPDVYEGAPALITAVMSTLVKTAVFAAFIRLVIECHLYMHMPVEIMLTLLAGATMAVGNLSALAQENFKRILAYSGISHAGYMMLTLLSVNAGSQSALLFYAASYSIASIGVFALAIPVFYFMKNEQVSAFNGLGKKNPWMAGLLTMLMLALAGIPPMSGFLAKYYIFSKSFQAGFFALTLFAVINSIVGVYYYFKVILAMYTKPADDTAVEPTPLFWSVIITCSILTLVLGLYPGGLLNLI